MKTTGISTLDHAPQVVAEWLNELCADLDWTEKGKAYLLFRTTLHTVRDVLSVGEAADISAQLPVLVRGIYFDGWVPSRVPRAWRTKVEFLAHIDEQFTKAPLEDTERAVVAVFDLLRRHVSMGEIEHVSRAMRKPLHDLWW